jgi:hypothetical protein
MDRFHRTSRGWLAQRLRGREWWILSLLLLFYLSLMIGPGRDLLQAHHIVVVPEVVSECSETISQVEAEQPDDETETFLGLP